MAISVEVKAKYGFNRIDNLIARLQTKIGIEEVLKNLRGFAIKLEKGHNEQGILVQMIDGQGQEKGRVYASPEAFMSNGISYLFFEYFGTGRHAEMEHVGVTKHFIESGFTEWFIPVAKVEKPLRYPIITINNTDFYIAHGAKPNHFLTDAEFQSREENKEIVKNKLEEMLKEVCK